MGKWENIRELSKVSLVVVCLFLFGSLDKVAAQAPRLDIPGANLEVSNAVPMTLIKKIALEKSKETWGPGAVGDPIPLADLNGDLVVYMVPFSIGKEEFPGYDEILQGIKEGRELQELIKNSDFENARQMYKSMDHGKVSAPKEVIISESTNPRRPPANPVRPDGSISNREEKRNIQRFASKKAIGADEFGTVLVSATYDRFPVLAYIHYLPPYYVNFDLALQKGQEIIGQGASLKSIYFLGPEGEYFEFKANSSSILLHSKTLEETTLSELKSSRISQAQPRAETSLSQERREKRKAELTKAWEKIKSEIGEK